MSSPNFVNALSYPPTFFGVGPTYDTYNRTISSYNISSNYESVTKTGCVQNIYGIPIRVSFNYNAGGLDFYCDSPAILYVQVGISPNNTSFGTMIYNVSGIDAASISNGSVTIPAGYYITFQSSTCNSQPQFTFLSISAADVPCLLSGSMILTPSGEIPIDDLQIGDLVTTHDQRSVPITKISQSIILKSDSKNAPYCIPKNSIAYPDIPSRDVLISPRHAFYDVSKHEWTLPVWKKGIQQELVGEKVHYFHIGLPDYEKDKLVSSNLTVDSWEDNGGL